MRKPGSPVRWYGGKGHLVNKIVPLMPKCRRYIEPFFGGGSVLFTKEPSEVEIINDIDSGIVNFFRVVQNPQNASIVKEKAYLTPYSREEWEYCRDTWQDCEDPIEKAYRWFVVARMSFSAYFGKSFGVAVTASTRGMPMTVSSWLGAIEMIPHATERLQNVRIENDDFRVFMKRYCTPDSFCYCDPPYVLDTRSRELYRHEMSVQDHSELVDLLLELPGRFMVSGYIHEVYKPLGEAGWKRVDFKTVCWAAPRTRASKLQGKGALLREQKRTESVWLDPETAQEVLPQNALHFD